MPRAQLPSTPTGWLVAVAAAVVGFLAGFVALAVITKLIGGGNGG